MGLLLIPFEEDHLHTLEILPDPGGGRAKILLRDYKVLESTLAWTVVLKEGTILACGGMIRHWAGRHVAWSVMSHEAGRYMLPITRIVKDMFDSVPGRIEMTCRADFAPGQRWAKMLGFEVENPPGVLKNYGCEGEDHIMYVRLKCQE